MYNARGLKIIIIILICNKTWWKCFTFYTYILYALDQYRTSWAVCCFIWPVRTYHTWPRGSRVMRFSVKMCIFLSHLEYIKARNIILKARIIIQEKNGGSKASLLGSRGLIILPIPARRYALFTCIVSAIGSLKVAVVLSNLLLYPTAPDSGWRYWTRVAHTARPIIGSGCIDVMC